jgi:hypothetical protein
VAPGWLDPYIIGHYQLEIANDIFNDVKTSDLIVLSRRPSVSGVAPCCQVACIVAVTGEWAATMTLHCRCNVVVCSHVLQVHDNSDVKRLKNVRACVGNMRVVPHR